MSHEEEIRYVKEILDLEKQKSETSGNLQKLKSQKFKDCSKAPTKQILPPTVYPQIVPDIKLNTTAIWLPMLISGIISISGVTGVLLGLFFLLPLSIVWAIVYFFVIFQSQKRTEIEKIRNSLEYRKQCSDLDKQHNEQQVKIDAEYEKQTIIYQTEILPKYQEELKQWIDSQNLKIDEIQKTLNNIDQNLQSLYNESQIIPTPYRKVGALKAIYEIITSSAYDVKTAIGMYEASEKKRIEQQRLNQINQGDVVSQVLPNAYRADLYGPRERSSGDSFIGRTVSTAIGTAIGNKISDRSRDTKKDLFGTPGCPYGKKAKIYDRSSPDFMTISCNMSCPFHNKCSRG